MGQEGSWIVSKLAFHEALELCYKRCAKNSDFRAGRQSQSETYGAIDP